MTVDEKGLKISGRSIEKVMKEQNEWDHRISAGVNEGPADCIRIVDDAAALKKMKSPKAPGLSGL